MPLVSGRTRPAPLQTEFSLFCEMNVLLKKKTHNKNEENTLKERNQILLAIWFAPLCIFYQNILLVKNEVQATWAESPLPKD